MKQRRQIIGSNELKHLLWRQFRTKLDTTTLIEIENELSDILIDSIGTLSFSLDTQMNNYS